MTPAINLLKKKNVDFSIHSYEHDPTAESYGGEAAEALGLTPERVFKTLLVSPQGGRAADLAVAIVPVSGQLNLKALASALALKKIEMADPTVAQKVTGYLVGGISPLGQKKQLPTVIDNSARSWETVFVSAGRRGLEVELSPESLATLCRGSFADIARD